MTLEWTARWEVDLGADEHRAITALLARAFPDGAAIFAGGHSWFGARPEARIVGRADGAVVAHLGLARRFVRVGGADVLVGVCGLVSVAPAAQGGGVGAQLLARAAEFLRAHDVPFGWLICQPHVVGFYERGGWQRVDAPVRLLERRGGVVDFDGPLMVLPLTDRPWPPGPVECNGYEL